MKAATKSISAQGHKSTSYKMEDVEAVGISYQMHGLVCVDKNQNVLRPSIIWCDSRAVQIGEKAAVDIAHYPKPVIQRKNNSLLCRPQKMSLLMYIKIPPVNGCPYISVFQCPLSPVTVRQYHQPVRPDRNLRR
ncbi:Xylulose kinase [subsurface metagenome]